MLNLEKIDLFVHQNPSENSIFQNIAPILSKLTPWLRHHRWDATEVKETLEEAFEAEEAGKIGITVL